MSITIANQHSTDHIAWTQNRKRNRVKIRILLDISWLRGGVSSFQHFSLGGLDGRNLVLHAVTQTERVFEDASSLERCAQ